MDFVAMSADLAHQSNLVLANDAMSANALPVDSVSPLPQVAYLTQNTHLRPLADLLPGSFVVLPTIPTVPGAMAVLGLDFQVALFRVGPIVDGSIEFCRVPCFFADAAAAVAEQNAALFRS